MLNKVIAVICFVLFSQICFAETCPSIKDIKKASIKGWTAFDSEDGKPLSSERLAQFKTLVEQFALAEWSNEDAKAGVIHCFYRDKEGAALEAYLAKSNFSPINQKNMWYEVSGAHQCAAGMKECEFKATILDRPQVAQK